MAASLSHNELFSKMDALLNDPNYILPDDVSEANRNWIRTGINMMARDPLPNPAISVEHAIRRTIRAPHGGRKPLSKRNQRNQRKQRNQRRKTRSR